MHATGFGANHMVKLRALRIGVFFVALSWLALTAHAAHTKVSLMLPAESVRPGETIAAVVKLQVEPRWHIYWANPGESGQTTSIEWKLLPGVTASAIKWPAPVRYAAEGLTTFILEGEVCLVVDLHFAADLPPGTLDLKARVDWLECKESCIPGSADVAGKLTVAAETKPSAEAALVKDIASRLPQPSDRLGLLAEWVDSKGEKSRVALLSWPAATAASAADFFPYASDDYEVKLAAEPRTTTGGQNSLRLEVTKAVANWPTNIAGILTLGKGAEHKSFEVNLPIGPKVSPAAAASSAPTNSASAPATSVAPSPTAQGEAQSGLLVQLCLAFLGGLILNLMPCVLPILSLKVLHLVAQRDLAIGAARKQAAIYTVGVLVSFWALAGLVLAGQLASWGEQFQDPRFVVVMAVLMTFVALNLFGLFEVVLPGATVSKASELAGKQGGAGAFFAGALSVVLGASCVAPVLAAAVGWAIAQSPAVIVMSFTAIGLGLAAPFVVLSCFPPARKLMPKPGAWMEKFKIILGFPMLATAIWLLAQTQTHYGSGGPLWVGLFLLICALAAWVYGVFYQRASHRRAWGFGLAVTLLLGGYSWMLEHELHWRTPSLQPGEPAGKAAPADGSGIAWQPWSGAAVAKARAEGHPVLVDFTADWCLTCQVNKKTSLEVDAVRAKLKELGVVALMGDYTRKNPEITAELKKYQRAGVPLVLVYPANPAKPAAILPTVLTPTIVLEALDTSNRP